MLWHVPFFIILCFNTAAGAAVNGNWSAWMASSIMSREQGIMTGSGGVSELLQAGITQRALTALAAQYPNMQVVAAAAQYVQTSAASVVPFVSNASYDALNYPLDRLSNGIALLTFSASSSGNGTKSNATQATSLHAAAVALRESINLNRRNPEGGLWYYVYPEWSYLDGMFSLAPFYTLYSLQTASFDGNSSAAALADMQLQLDLLWQHNRNASSGLLVHGYDASRTAVWANNVTGASPHVWGRALGWYSIALVDTLELLPESQSQSQHLLTLWQSLASALIEAADPATGGWWQIMDEPGREGNYIESSGSAMFSYALLKGARLGYLAEAVTSTAKSVGVRAQRYLTETFVVHNANGTLGWNGTVAVCSLNSTASYEYYIEQPINYNSVLGSAAYVLASLEVERIGNA